MHDGNVRRWGVRAIALASALVVVRLFVPWWCGRDPPSAPPPERSAPPPGACRWRSSRVWRALAPYASLVPGLAVYGVLRVVFAHVMGSHGLVTPSGPPSTGLAVCGLIMIVLRLAVLVIVPLVITYRVVRRLVELAAGLRSR